MGIKCQDLWVQNCTERWNNSRWTTSEKADKGLIRRGKEQFQGQNSWDVRQVKIINFS